MTASPASRLGRAILVGAALALSGVLPALPAAAQSAPVPLFPPAAPEKQREGAPAPGESVPPVDAQPREKSGGILIDRLDRPGLDGIGVVGPGSGGFGLDLWQGSDRRVIARLLPKLSASLDSPALRDLARRLLLSSAPPPEGAGGDEPGGGNLLLLRAERLRALGESQALEQLMRVVPQSADVEAPIARLRVEAALLGRQGEAACQQVRNALSRFPAQGFWSKALIYCQIAGGERAAAELGLDLLREAGGADPEFIGLANAALGVGAPPPVAAPSPLELSLLALAGGLADGLPEDPDPGTLAWVALSENAAIETRLAAAERAVAAGALAADSLPALYAEPRFDAQEIDGALALAPSLPAVRARALLYQAAVAQPLPAARAELLAALVGETPPPLRGAVMRAIRPQLESTPPAPDLAWFAPLAARALLLEGRGEAASAWNALLRHGVARDPALAPEEERLRALLRLAGTATAEPQAAAFGSADVAPEVAESSEEIVAAALLAALGEEVAVTWADAVEVETSTSAVASAPLIYALRQAAGQARQGETVLLVLLLLGNSGTEEAHLLMLDEALRALSSVELGAEARALAIEAAVRRGL